MASESFEFHTWLKPGLGPAYEEFHRAIPAELDAAMRSAGVIDWRIYRRREVLTHRVAAADRSMMSSTLAEDPVNQRWQGQVAPYLADAGEPPDSCDPGTLVWDFSWPTS